MPRRSHTARLVIALSVAAVLAVFLVYVAFAGNRTPQLSPSELAGHTGKVSLVGKVVGPGGAASVPVVYHGSVPDLFKVGRHIVVDGRYRNGVFAAQRDSLVTKCPSKYTPKKA